MTKQNKPSWLDALLEREDHLEILTAYLNNNLGNAMCQKNIIGVNKIMHEQFGPLLEIHYTSKHRLDPRERIQDPIYFGEHTLYTLDKDGNLINQLNIDTLQQPIITDIFNILARVNRHIVIDECIYESAHLTYCKKELARQYIEESKRLKEEFKKKEQALKEGYNSAIETFPDVLAESRLKFKYTQSNKYSTM